MRCHFILYVRDQETSMRFYRAALGKEPRLHVPGMTEFELREGCVLGLMPEKGIKRLLGSALPDPETANGASRAELYLLVDDPALFFDRAREAGAKVLSALAPRNWGDEAAYLLDPDGHVVAFARSGS